MDGIANVLLGYGPLGIIVLVLTPFVRSLIKREQERADRLEEDLSRQRELFADKIVPVLTLATESINSSQTATAAALDYIRKLQYEADIRRETEERARREGR